MRLAVLGEPFDHPDWIFELKYDGFRSLAVCDGTTTKLISRRQNAYRSFQPLATEITAAMGGRGATMEGEIVALDSEGRPQFFELLRRRGDPVFVAFDLLRLANRDISELHQGKGNVLLFPSTETPQTALESTVRRQKRLGGLLNHYCRAA
jgi:bifunctional non-homologous end joining protein LigD